MIKRSLVASLSVSAAALIGLAVSEGYVGEAMTPTKGDRPTLGFGSTFHADGRPVQLGDRTDPVRALVTLRAHVDKEEAAFQRSLPGARLTQGEYDLYMDFVYQYGTGAWSGSSMRRRILAQDYRGACDALLLWRKQGGRDCSLPQHWGPQGCKGVWTRQLERHAKCLAEQEG
ncbi:glycoside hydrolase family protein [Thauera chlorobenzoica]|uniref:glycoside hydrolase family protein n=1 Tax=Thauera chlorobenzoica TaxID=96773 RepID=UPI0008A02C75|nr:glycoside hydrolase family protein [Thauera chlorobenzoica]SEG31448.1 Phage-related lysozyme (muramidase), GH24 family [Thauera chlorobenzoica]